MGNWQHSFQCFSLIACHQVDIYSQQQCTIDRFSPGGSVPNLVFQVFHQFIRHCESIHFASGHLSFHLSKHHRCIQRPGSLHKEPKARYFKSGYLHLNSTETLDLFSNPFVCFLVFMVFSGVFSNIQAQIVSTLSILIFSSSFCFHKALQEEPLSVLF